MLQLLTAEIDSDMSDLIQAHDSGSQSGRPPEAPQVIGAVSHRCHRSSEF
jgi:hypothetical protein